jgi:hypothetical protein
MTKKSAGCTRAQFVEEFKATNNLITDAQAIDIYNVLDAVQVLIAIPVGKRIVVKKDS